LEVFDNILINEREETPSTPLEMVQCLWAMESQMRLLQMYQEKFSSVLTSAQELQRQVNICYGCP
jgi:hypothetical protein